MGVGADRMVSVHPADHAFLALLNLCTAHQRIPSESCLARADGVVIEHPAGSVNATVALAGVVAVPVIAAHT